MSETGHFAANCCCGSVTGLQGGLHPEVIQSTRIDLSSASDTETSIPKGRDVELIIGEPCHILGATASLACYNSIADGSDKGQPADVTIAGGSTAYYQTDTAINQYIHTPMHVGLFATGELDTAKEGGFGTDTDENEPRQYFATLSVNAVHPQAKTEDWLWGYFADGGVGAEIHCATSLAGVTIQLFWVARNDFSPAYTPVERVQQHYWFCGSNDNFLDGFYPGTSNHDDDADDPDSPFDGSGTLSPTPT